MSEVVVHPDKDVLAAAVAARLITALVDAVAARGVAHVVLTGGGVGTAVLRATADSPACGAVDWSRVHVWWGDERFVPAGSEDRNETGARSALLDRVPLDPAHVHVVAPSDGPLGDDVDAAAAAYAQELAAAGDPVFDVLMLGVGPDGHVASLFPGQPGLRESERTVIAVRDSPKPPPVRISLTYPAIRRAEQVWLVAAGEEKAEAVAAALGGADLPAATATGRRTLWLLDHAAASDLG